MPADSRSALLLFAACREETGARSAGLSSFTSPALEPLVRFLHGRRIGLPRHSMTPAGAARRRLSASGNILMNPLLTVSFFVQWEMRYACFCCLILASLFSHERCSSFLVIVTLRARPIPNLILSPTSFLSLRCVLCGELLPGQSFLSLTGCLVGGHGIPPTFGQSVDGAGTRNA